MLVKVGVVSERRKRRRRRMREIEGCILGLDGRHLIINSME